MVRASTDRMRLRPLPRSSGVPRNPAPGPQAPP